MPNENAANENPQERKFAVVRDADGDQQDATLENFAELQSQGYRLVDTAAYEAAINARTQEQQAAQNQEGAQQPQPGTAEAAMAERTATDASQMAVEQYPDSEAGEADQDVRARAEQQSREQADQQAQAQQQAQEQARANQQADQQAQQQADQQAQTRSGSQTSNQKSGETKR
jgi:transcription factor SPT20